MIVLFAFSEGGRGTGRGQRLSGGREVGLSALDGVALALFVAAWIAYHLAVERTPAGRRSLNMGMNAHRHGWMRQMLARDNRMMDANINASLQNGTAFFASTSLIAVGSALTLFRSTEEVMNLFAELPLGARHDPRGLGDQGARPRDDLRLRVPQVRLVLPPVQLCRDPARRGAAGWAGRPAPRWTRRSG